MPGLLLWIAADALIRGPSWALSWRLLHDPQLATAPAWLRPFLPAGAPFDRDPLALLLAGGATGLAASYLGVCLAGCGARVRAGLLAAAFALVVLLPSFLYMSIGFVTQRPFGQDGGVVQLPLALDRLLDGKSPYGADYSDSMLGKQSRASAFWRGYGGNPIVRHHAYLPGTHLAMLPSYLAARALGLPFDTRAVTLLALAVAVLLAASLFDDAARRLTAAALVALNPLVYWHQAFGANDPLFVAMLLGATRLLASGRATGGGALLGLACATKQLAWPFAPFLLLTAARPRLRGAALAAAAVFGLVVGPVAALDLRAFAGDIVLYNLGLGSDLYPYGGTPGIGFANFVLYLGGVRSLREPLSFGAGLLVLLPLGIALLHAQRRRGDVAMSLAAGSVALLAALYFSRVPHPNYLIAVATLLPLAALLRGMPADGALVPLSLLALAATVVERGCFVSLWQDAREAGWTALASRADPALVSDPLGLALSAAAAGLALVYAAASVLGAGARVRRTLSALAILVVVVVPTLLSVAISSKASEARAQERALVPAPDAREAWSSSFRLEPAAALEGRRETSAVAALVGSALRAAGVGDARAFGLVALVAALALASRLATGSNPALAWALVALFPPAALGAILGSDVPLWLAVILIALAMSRASLATRCRAGAIVGLTALLDATLSAVVPHDDLGPGVGLVNIVAYAGGASARGLRLGLALGLFAAAAVVVWTWRRASSSSEALAGAALAWLLALFFASAASPFHLALPLALVALAALVERSPGSTGVGGPPRDRRHA